MRLMRDWLRHSPDDLKLYADTKRRLALQPWEFVQQYADAKSEVVTTIISHAEAWAAARVPDAKSARYCKAPRPP